MSTAVRDDIWVVRSRFRRSSFGSGDGDGDGDTIYALRVTVVYSDTFLVARGCHCNGLLLYLSYVDTSPNTENVKYSVGLVV